jgi:hypothetical protein
VLETLLLMLASADRQMRVLTPIILRQALLMSRVQTKVLFRSTMKAEREAAIHPDRQLDDGRWKTVTNDRRSCSCPDP